MQNEKDLCERIVIEGSENSNGWLKRNVDVNSFPRFQEGFLS